jgi:hypothetical protein
MINISQTSREADVSAVARHTNEPIHRLSPAFAPSQSLCVVFAEAGNNNDEVG